MPDVIVALGEQALLEGFTLAGVEFHGAETDRAVCEGWAQLPENTGMVILTPRAAAALGPVISDPHSPMTVVLPL
jgi:hypothetical protein